MKHHTVTPHLVVRDAAKAIEFYEKAFGAEKIMALNMPDNKIIHASIKLGDSMVMLNDEFPEWNALSPLSLNGSSVTIHLSVEDVDAAFSRAVNAGATITMPLANQFWGDRYGVLKDPFGHQWSVAQQVEQLSPEEVQKRALEFFSQPHPNCE